MNSFLSNRAAHIALLGVLVIFPLVLGGPAGAQVVKGSISGSVVDPSGAVVPGVDITARNTATQEQSTTRSDSAGLFRLNLLSVGDYNLEFTKQGFKKLLLGHVSVSAGADHGLGSVALELGAMSVVVEVSAAPAILESSEAQVSTTLTSQQITDYSGIQENQGLDFLALQLPGVANTRDNTFSNSNGVGFSVDGIRGRNNDQEIDGQNNNDNSVAGPALALSNPDFVQQYQITTNNFSPEYGRNAGSVVNLITPAGTNTWHGTIAGTEQNSVLTTLTNTQKNKVWGEGLTRPPWFNTVFASTTVGGPVVKDKVFIFGGFDTNISETTAIAETGSYMPTPIGVGELAACYPNSDSVAALRTYGPFGIGAGNPTAVGPITLQTVGPNGITPCSVQIGHVERVLGTPYHEYDYITRADFLRGSNRLYVRYLFTHYNWIDGDGDLAGGYPYNVYGLSQDGLIGWSRPITNNMTNELRVSFSRINVGFGGNNIGNTVPMPSNLTTALSLISIGNDGPASFDNIGPPDNIPQGRVVNTYQVQDNWTYVHGRNQWKAGVNFSYERSPNFFLPYVNGAFSFSPFTAPATGFTSTDAAGNTVCTLPAGTLLDSLAAFACDIPSSTKIASGNPELPFRETDTFLYVGNDYKVRPNLTLNLGLTWTYFGQPANLFHTLDLERQTGSEPFWNPSLPTSITVFPSIPAPKKSFGPGIGFAYTPHWGQALFGKDKTVFRGGYRLSYDPPFYNIYLNISSAAPQAMTQVLTGTKAASIPMLLDPTGPNVRTQLASYLTYGVYDPRSFYETTVVPNFKPDGVQSWSFGIQRQLGAGAVFEARYVGNHGFNLFQSINANPYIAGVYAEFPSALPPNVTPCSAADAVVASAVGRVSCNEGIVRERTNTGYSDYNGLQLDLRSSQLFHQLTLHTSYTWSKTTDNVSEIFSTFGGATTYAFSQNPLNYTTAEHGLSGLDFPNSWTLNFVEAIPAFRHQEGIVGHVLGGWSLSGNYIIQSGQVYTPIQYYSSTFSGGVGQDTAFDTTAIGTFETSRPFLSNPSAPATTVGIYAGDACSLDGIGCALPPNTLLDDVAVNATGEAHSVQKSQVHFIVNGGEAQSLYGTPWGTAARNGLRDYHTNTANFSLVKTIKFNERAHLDWRMDMLNVFNHPNYGSVDPFIEDAGYQGIGTGFANPMFTSGGNRSIAFVIKIVY